MSPVPPRELLPGLYCFAGACNTHVVRRGDRAIAIDFGVGDWLDALPALGVRRLEHVLLTHHHADQAAGLMPFDSSSVGGAGSGLSHPVARDCQVHAPIGEEQFLAPVRVEEFWRRRREGTGYPASFSVLARGVPGVLYDLAPGARDFFWDPDGAGALRVRFVSTPGHGPHALSAIADVAGRQVVFCGDAVHAGATIWQPYNLEWDHFTGKGALAAWEGVRRLQQIRVDMLCPSHGPVIADKPRQTLVALGRKLMRFYDAKGSICHGERDGYWPATVEGERAMRVLPHLVHFGMNGYLLLSAAGEALVVDPTRRDMDALEALLPRLGAPKLTAAIASHYHLDHVDGIPLLQERYGARACLHPWVAEPICDRARFGGPYLPAMDIRADELLPERGQWRWNEYVFDVAPFPGQTWWHAAHQTVVDGRKVFFGGDSFQPASRWLGTGGFCALNRSRFRDGYIPSAQLVIDWAPDLLCNGHKTFFRFRRSQFRKIQRWAASAEQAVAALCPSGDLDADYYVAREA